MDKDSVKIKDYSALVPGIKNKNKGPIATLDGDPVALGNHHYTKSAATIECIKSL